MGSEHVQIRHEQSFRFFLDCWLSEDRRTAFEMSEEEAAYSTLEHGGLWVRLQHTVLLPAELEQLPQPDRVRLVRAACRFAAGFSLPDHFGRLVKEDLPEPEEMEEMERLLTQIDALDAAVDLAVRLVDPLLQADSDLLAELARTRCIVAGMVQQFSDYPDVAAVASRFVLVQRELRYLEDGRPADWFTRMREWDREFFDPSLSEFTGLSSAPKEDHPRQPATDSESETKHAAVVEYAQAAGVAEDLPPLLHRLATTSPPEGTSDYRQAWVHFQACCFLGTSGALDWLRLFLEAAGEAQSLTEDWKVRVQRAEAIRSQRNWKDRYRGSGVFALEPRPLGNTEEFFRWLQELTGSPVSN